MTDTIINSDKKTEDYLQRMLFMNLYGWTAYRQTFKRK